MSMDRIVKEAKFKCNIDQLWQAITDQNQISKWFLQADFKPEKDYAYTFNSSGNDCQPIVGRVISATPYTLIYTWEVKGTNVETTVEWILESKDNLTKLTLIHSGISNYDDETAIAMFESFDKGWDNCISGLTIFVDK